MRQLRVSEPRSEEVADGREEEPIVRGRLATGYHRDRPEGLPVCAQVGDEEIVIACLLGTLECVRDCRGECRIVGDVPGATEAVDAAKPERRVCAIELARDRRENAGHFSTDGLAGCQCASN